MKKIYFSLASLLVLSLSFGQVSPKKTPINGTSIKTGSFTVNSTFQGNNTVQSQNNLPGLSNNGTSTVANQNDPHGHYCKSHQLTQQHYEEQGVWDQSYQQYMIDAASMVNYTQNKAAGPNTIPVIFHVVHEGEPVGTGTNVSNAAIMNMFNDLVEDFQLLNADASNARAGYGFTPADANIDFCLAQQDPNGLPLSETGVVRVQTTETWFDPDDNGEVNAMKSAPLGSPIWDRNDYLNVWICDISNGAGSGTAGYAYRPQGGFLPNSQIDGIVVDYNLGVNNDNVLTHEVGHYLGLMHTWGNSGGCSDDDGFSDTPQTAGPSFNYGGSCSGNQSVCGSIQTQYENYMDYSNCTVMFTQEQVNYMDNLLNTLRSSLFLSNGCDPAGPPICSFTSSPAGPVTISTNGTVIFQDNSTGGPTSWTWTISGTQGTDWAYTGGTNANSQNPEVTFYNTGTYNVTLVASNGFGACTGSTQNSYVTVIAPSTGTQCDTLRNWNPLTEGLAWYDNNLDWGYLCGHGVISGFPIQEYAEKYTPTASAEVRRIRVPVMLVEDNSGTGTVNFIVSDDDNGGTDPGTILGGVTVPLANLNDFAWNEIDLPTPVAVTGSFWVSVQLNYGSPQDTLSIAIADLNDRPAGAGTTRWYIAGGWYGTDDIYVAPGVNMSVAWDVLLSNGPDPVADLQVDATEVCIGGQISGNGSGSTNTTNYYWYQTDDNPTTTIYDIQYTAGVTFDFGGLTAGDYELWLFADGSCKSDYDTVDISLYNVPNATINATNTTCGQNNGVISFTGPSGGNGSYEYSINGGATWSTTSTYNNLPAGTYDVAIRTSGDGCEATASVTLNASTALSGTVTPTVTALCEGQSTTLTASGGTTYDWYDGGTLVQSGATNTLTVTPTATAQYSVEISDGTCTDLQLATVNVTALDDATFNFADFCDGSANGATGIVTPGGTFAFNPAPGDGASINPSTGEITNETQITYTVEYTTSGTCPSTSTETVTVSLSDDPSFTTADFCAGSSNTVNVTGTTGGTFTYDGADASSINPSTGVITNGVSGTTYNITYTTPAGACQAVSAPLAVTVLATPTVNSVANQTICSGDSFTAINFSGTGGGTYSWTNNNTNIGLGVNGSGNIAAFAGTTSGASTTSTITVTPTNGSCTGTSTNFTLTVNLTPSVGAGTDQSICDGDQVTLTASNPDGATISWDNSVTNGVAFTPSVGSVTYTATATLGSCTATDQVVVTVDITPGVNAGLNDTICQGTSYTLTATNPDAATITWDNGVSDGVAFTATNSGSTIYTATATIGACSSSDQMILVVDPAPVVTGVVTDANGGNNGAIDASVTSGTGTTMTYSWSSGQTTEDITGIGAGTYTLTVTDSLGCIGSETFTVQDVASVDEFAGSTLLIYPNPTNGAFTIQLEGKYELAITDARGRLILQQSAADLTEFDLRDHESGMYFIRIVKDGEMIVKKLMLE